MGYLKITGGTVYDPANGIDGQIRDLWIQDGRIVAAPGDGATQVSEVNVAGNVVMPGGVDMHCHVAGSKVNAARQMQPEQIRDVQQSGVTDIYTTGHRYTGLGYTTCFDAAISPLAARQVHHEFRELPNLDAGFFVLVGNNHFVMHSVAANQPSELRSFLGWLIRRVGAYAPKIVNPGGVELWKQRREGNATDLDQTVDGFEVTPRQILAQVARAANELNLPHPLHVHCNNLGIPGNWTTTLETMRTLAGQRSHLTHIQFHSYGGGMSTGDQAAENTLSSRVRPLAEFINQHPELTVDVGQVMFGRTTSMTGDAPLGYYLHQVNGEKWYSNDTEIESGCGVSPIEYRDRNFVNALQWAIGLEWYLLVEDPWQIVMSTDHPNGGSFTAYPRIIRLLMDSAYRREQLGQVNPRVLKHSSLSQLDREYSLGEIAIISRAGPARILGLNNKGHLGVGADADITVYAPDANYEKMFSIPRWVFKSGRAVIANHEVMPTENGKLISHCPNYDRDADPQIEDWFNDNYSIRVENFGMETDPV